MITITEQAQKKIIQNLAKRGKGIGIKLGVRTTGCSGLAYVLEYVDNLWEGSTTYIQDKVTIVVDNRDLPYLDGMHVDYVRQGLNEGFEFTNPNAKDSCGCGESFRV
jgi:iron-sulfur cluster assembly protein